MTVLRDLFARGCCHVMGISTTARTTSPTRENTSGTFCHLFLTEYKHPCSELVISACQGIPGFTHTVVSEDLQRKYGKFIEKIIGNFSADPKCGEMRKQIVCAENMPACLNGTAGFLCRKRCENFFNQCKSPFFYGRDMCMEFPDKDNYTDDSPICKQTHWPRYGNWPSPEPTTIPTRLVTSTTITGSLCRSSIFWLLFCSFCYV